MNVFVLFILELKTSQKIPSVCLSVGMYVCLFVRSIRGHDNFWMG